MNEELVQVVHPLPALLQRRELMLSPVMDLELAKSRMKEFQEFVAHYLEESKDGGQDGGDYGAIPGAGKKKVLFKSGGDKLTELYGLYDEYIVEAQEDFAANLFYYKITCILKSRRDDGPVGTGLGSCSTYESKYRWRDSQRKCPKCQAAAIIKGKDFQNTGKPTGWLCWTKKNGCGAAFKDGDVAIEGQTLERVENPDIMDTVNTVLKMAKKRAKLDAVIAVTRSSGIFTQDLEDLPMPAPKPVVAVTTEDIPISGPTRSGGAEESGKEEATDAPKSRTLGFDPDAPIDKPRQAALHKAFREAIGDEKARAHADTFLRDWLFHQGYKDEAGKGSTKPITLGLFEEVKANACKFAEGLA